VVSRSDKRSFKRKFPCHIGCMRKKLTAKTVENLPEAQGRDMRSGTLLSGALASSDVQRCDEVQGFFYAKPLPISEFEKFLRSSQVHSPVFV
jgi:hypothetical protein